MTCIKGNKIGADGARALAGALGRNASVTTLHLGVRKWVEEADWIGLHESLEGMVSDMHSGEQYWR